MISDKKNWNPGSHQDMILLLAFLALLIRHGQSYKAAVLESNPQTGNTPLDTILKNLQTYRRSVEEARRQNVDIIVFTEYGLTTLVDDPTGYAIELTSNNTILQYLHNMAVENSIYIVVNLLEKVNDNNKTKYFNTNLVYNRKGEIIAKYRKINLFNEPNLTPGNETVTFSTDFGVTFGIMTCFDILYYNPSRTLLDDGKISDIVYPVAWFSTMPFYTALTVQHGYFVANKINLLAANYNQPKEGHGGSGIYMSHGNSADIYISPTINNKLIIHDVPEINNTVLVHTQQSDISNFLTYRDFKASDYHFQNIDLRQKTSFHKICYEQFCCNFNLSIQQPANTQEIYKLMAYDGKVIFDRSEVHIRVCALLACQNDTDDSCGARINGTTTFTRITVDGVFPKDGVTFYTPITLNYQLLPILETSYYDSTINKCSQIELTTNAAQRNVLVYGIFGKTDSSV